MEVTIIQIVPMIVASFYAFGKSPEEDAYTKLAHWAEPKGFLHDPEKYPVFGFNNPPPAGPGMKYGYEVWIKVAPKTEPENDMRICFFKGGKYAMTRCIGANKIHDTWMDLFKWCKNNNYKEGMRHGLEKVATMDNPENMVLELYLPVYI